MFLRIVIYLLYFMKKQILLSFIFLLLVGQAMAQNKTIDSLKLALKNAKHDTTQCNILNQMIEAESDPKLGSAYNDQLKSKCEAFFKTASTSRSLEKFYTKQLAAAYNNVGFYAYLEGNFKKAIQSFEKALKLQKEINDIVGVSGTLNNLAEIYNRQGNDVSALECHNKTLKIREKLKDEYGIALTLNNLASIYTRRGELPLAMKYFTRSLKIREKINDKHGMSISLNNIANIYESQGEIKSALEYYTKSLKLREEINDQRGKATCLNNLGYLYMNQGNNSLAINYYNKSLKISEDINDPSGVSTSLDNLGNVYEKQGDINRAVECYHKALKLQEETGNLMETSVSLNNIATALIKQGAWKEAQVFSERSLKISRELGYPEHISYASNTLSKIYAYLNNWKGAYEMHYLYKQMNDSIKNETNRKDAIKKSLQYEYEKKTEADSIRSEEERKVFDARMKQERTQRLALYGGLVLVLVFAVFMFNRFRVTQKQKNIIELKEKETQQQNEIITIQKHLVEEKHKEITDSINYAERIQRSFLATKELLDENLKEYFVFFKPKDVVSGDFYWSAKLSNGNFALATADSTGHGVPGAIMSLLNVTSLEKAIEHHINPADILNHTRQTIIERLKKDGSEEGGKDGMDCSLLVFDFVSPFKGGAQRAGDVAAILHIAAANNPVWIIRNNELIEIKPDKMPVGKSDKQDQSFTTHTLELQKGDTIYTLTDGFPDQFGGDKGKKFMSKKLKELLLANVHLPISQQKELLDTTFKNWVGNLEQVDDVTVIGIKV